MIYVFHVFPVLVEEREKFLFYLEEEGIEYNIHYPIPIFRQEAYKEYAGEIKKFPVTEKICAEEISIPLYPGLTGREIDYIILKLNMFK